MQRYYNQIIQINKFTHQQAFKLNYVTNKFHNFNRKISNSKQLIDNNVISNRQLINIYFNFASCIWFYTIGSTIAYYKTKGYSCDEILSKVITISTITCPLWSFLTVPHQLVSDPRLRDKDIENKYKLNNR